MEIEQSVKTLLAPIWKDALKQKIPAYLQMELTSRCNLMCRMCYVASNCEQNWNRELSAAEWLDIARQARDMGLMVVNITGGEPIMKRDFWQIYEGLANLGVIYTLNTNGTLMTKENVKRLTQAPPFRALASIYGGSHDTYAKLTTSGEWFDQARAGIENLLEAGIPTIIRMTVVKGNINDLPKIFEWTESLGQDLFFTDYMFARREGEETDPFSARLSPDERIQFRDTLKKLYQKKDSKKNPQTNQPEKESESVQPEEKTTEQPEEPGPSEPYRFVTEDGFSCGSGQSSGFISYDGNIYPCGIGSEPLVGVRGRPFSDVWGELVKLSRKIPSCTECEACQYAKNCVPCPPKLMSETGSFCKKAPYLCEYTEKTIAYYEKLN